MLSILIRIRKRSRKSLDWLRGWFHAHITLRWLCWTHQPLRDLALFQRRIPFIERREYSQNGEDGIITAIFAKIGVTNRFCVEFGVEDGLQCNCRYLLRHKGWTGLLMDGGDWPTTIHKQNNKHIQEQTSNSQQEGWHATGGEEEGYALHESSARRRDDAEALEASARRHGAGRSGDWRAGVLAPPLSPDKGGKRDACGVYQEFITAENIEELFRKYGVPEAFDLLSIDIDGNDYWVWKAITHFHPRVVVIEYNASKGPDATVTIPYDPQFRWDGTDYQGASLGALEKMGREKGYTLVATDRNGVNAFFVESSLVEGNFTPPPFAQIFHPPAYKGIPGKAHPPDPKGRPWVSV